MSHRPEKKGYEVSPCLIPQI